ncbi:MAG: DNA-binding transcriptional ArsR family regulator [Planctomycetota bacterium]|jgi:DNA-binding transcriptional ArsR family regulator
MDGDLAWRALADSTRRQILDLLRKQPLPAGRLAEHFSMSRFGVRKHLQILEYAALIRIEARGRERWQTSRRHRSAPLKSPPLTPSWRSSSA